MIEEQNLQNENVKASIDWNLYQKFKKLGIIPSEERSFNIGKSDYSKHIIQPWSIWIDYNLNAFDADIIKRVLRTKEGDSRMMDYNKIIHICKERIRQLKEDNEAVKNPTSINSSVTLDE